MALGWIAMAMIVTITHGIFEDQIDKFDWIKKNIGVVKIVQSSSKNSREFYVATEKNVLAKLSTKTETLIWRHVFDEDEIIDDIVLTSHGILSLSRNGRLSRMWSLLDGSLLWDSSLITYYAEASGPAAVVSVKDSLAILSNNNIFCLDSKNGKLIWNWNPLVLDKDLTIQTIIQNDENLLILLSSDSSTISIKLDRISGETISSTTFPKLFQEISVIKNYNIPLLTQVSQSKLFLWEIVEGKEHEILLPQDFLVSKKDKDIPIIWKNISSSIVVQLKNKYLFYSPYTHELVFSLNLQSNEKLIINDGNINDLITIIQSPVTSSLSSINKSMSMKVWNIKTQKELFIMNALDNERTLDFNLYGSVSKTFPIFSRKANGELLYRYVNVMEDDALVLYKENQLIWLREESLASIVQVEWVTPSDSSFNIPTLVPSLLDNFNLLMKQIPQFGQNHDSKSHFFGFTKLLLIMTNSGKLFAFHTETGTIFWAKFISTSTNSHHQLVIIRDHPFQDQGPELLVLKRKLDKTVEAIWINTDNGKEIEHKALPSNFIASFLLESHKHHSSGNSLLVFINDSLDVFIYPDTEDAKTIFLSESSNLYFHLYKNETNSFSGYKIRRSSNGFSFKAIKAWNLVFSSTEQIAQVAHTPSKQVVDSPATITGDDSLLLKYINPHMFTVATIDKTIQDDLNSIQTLTFYLIDAVTGKILHRIFHKHGDFPINIVQTMNNVIYSFWNTNKLRSEIGSLALYEGAINQYGINPWKSPILPKNASSFSSKLPIVLQKAFIFPTTIHALSPTLTAQGITPTHLLVGMASGQIYSLPSQLIDPRRPEVQPSLEQQSEGLMQYVPYLPILSNPLGMVSYNKTIANIKHITTFPAALESTSLAFAYGLDMFYVRVTPAKPFDLLAADFNYELLILLVVGLAGATLVLRNLSSRKEINDAWK